MANSPIIITSEDVKNPNLLVRVLRTLADAVNSLGNRLDAIVKDLRAPSFFQIRDALQATGPAPLNITSLRGTVADPQPAGMLRYDSGTAPAGLVLQSLRDTQLFALKNGTVYDIYMVVGGNPNTTVKILSGVAAVAHNLLSATHSDTVAASPVLGDIPYGNATPAWTKLAGNTTTTKKFFSQTGTGAASAVPAWAQPATSDLSDVVTWTTPAFSATDFTATGGGTWTVAAGDVLTYKYIIMGKLMTVCFLLNATTVAGAPVQLQIKIPASKTSGGSQIENGYLYSDNGAAYLVGWAVVPVSSTVIQLYLAGITGAWANATDTTVVRGQITFEIV